MGIINIPGKTTCSVKAAPEAETLLPGRWSLVSHSSSVMGTLVSRAAARGFGFAKILGTGNEADLTAGEIACLLVDDPETDAILLFLETIRRPELFEEAARRPRPWLSRSDEGRPFSASQGRRQFLPAGRLGRCERSRDQSGDRPGGRPGRGDGGCAADAGIASARRYQLNVRPSSTSSGMVATNAIRAAVKCLVSVS